MVLDTLVHLVDVDHIVIRVIRIIGIIAERSTIETFSKLVPEKVRASELFSGKWPSKGIARGIPLKSCLLSLSLSLDDVRLAWVIYHVDCDARTTKKLVFLSDLETNYIQNRLERSDLFDASWRRR